MQNSRVGRGAGPDLADAEPLEGPPSCDQVFGEIGLVLAAFLGLAAIAAALFGAAGIG